MTHGRHHDSPFTLSLTDQGNTHPPKQNHSILPDLHYIAAVCVNHHVHAAPLLLEVSSDLHKESVTEWGDKMHVHLMNTKSLQVQCIFLGS